MAKISKFQELFSRRWHSSNGEQSLSDIVYQHGIAGQAILYGALYIPEFIEVSDSVLLKWNLPDKEAENRFSAQLKVGELSRVELEASFNLVEVGYLFAPIGRDTSDEEDKLLAELLKVSWAAHLTHQFRDREFVVEVLSADDTGSTVGICFYEDRR